MNSLFLECTRCSEHQPHQHLRVEIVLANKSRYREGDVDLCVKLIGQLGGVDPSRTRPAGCLPLDHLGGAPSSPRAW
jgi:hypothetical protein